MPDRKRIMILAFKSNRNMFQILSTSTAVSFGQQLVDRLDVSLSLAYLFNALSSPSLGTVTNKHLKGLTFLNPDGIEKYNMIL